ncbi:uncharacterized protein TRIADDRAFT_53001 [Trichoplax adhaerens]|uniref:Uncharacterized protein n=1 Tax=Trichoplax adhaerens TaxID=10228 RepID=B3RN14_TRIAD|nr:hypothetical protein TRIADDRAFT_53001 [Trichoplax adhaerens]EDV27939.1 hypothetical protein TRIADDRAFT_53001 [Trichoplax adhaerens]|eukprot:XP_002109773.1 hypothetical protein TRIADDRAFT_53001 [Trichoplax adhaerens]
MSLANLRFWGKNKVAFANLPNNKEIPLEIRGSIISDAKFNPDENSTRDLFWAAKSGDIDILEDYLSDSDIVHDKFECNRLDRHKLSPLHYAAKYNRIDVVKYLLRYGADIDCIGGDGVTPLLIAAKHNSVDALKVLITLNGSTTLSNCNGESPLHVASRLGHIEACKALLEVSPILVNRVDHDKMTALHIACVKAKKEVCACLAS